MWEQCLFIGGPISGERAEIPEDENVWYVMLPPVAVDPRNEDSSKLIPARRVRYERFSKLKLFLLADVE